MQAIVYERPGKLVLKEIDELQPNENEVVIRIAYSGICGTDTFI
jgi:D-arabinose 1-dehydrogenase-like Zn-dependent alcohol dehydrogenase